jgi:23S rRNA (uracil1939-C5)-methyltransferase
MLDHLNIGEEINHFTKTPLVQLWTGEVLRKNIFETVCLLSKLQSKEHIEIEVKMDELDLTSAESKATYEEIKAYVLEHTGLKVSHLYIAQVKQKYGIIERENYNKPKSENAKQPQCPPDKENAIMEALKHFGMIL